MHAQQIISLAIFAMAACASTLTTGVLAAPSAVEAVEKRGGSSITYYAGHMLDNPACGGPTPTDDSMIGAVQEGGRFNCGDRLRINYKGNQVTVKVVDYCGDCDWQDVDLTKGAFRQLAPLKIGRLSADVSFA